MSKKPQFPVKLVSPTSTEGRSIIADISTSATRRTVQIAATLGDPTAESIRPLPREVPEENMVQNQDFKTWLAVYFVNKGSFRITDKGIDALSQRSQMGMEYLEDYSAKDRDESVTGRVVLSKKQRKETAMAAVAVAIEEGRATELVERGYVKHVATWKDQSVRIAVITKLLKVLGKNTREILHEDFSANGLGGLVASYYSDSSYFALAAAGFSWSLKEICDQADTKMSFQKFESSGKVYPWEMSKSPSIYDQSKIRISAVRWLVWKAEKNIREITAEDFRQNGLGSFLSGRYNGSPYLALVEGGFAWSFAETFEQAKTSAFQKFEDSKKIYSWEMEYSPREYDNSVLRIAASRWLVWKCGKNAREITEQDFNQNGLRGVLSKYHSESAYLALLDAGVVTPSDEEYMRSKQHTR